MPQITQEQREQATKVLATCLDAGMDVMLCTNTWNIVPNKGHTSPPPAATKPKAKTTPTKPKRKSNGFTEFLSVCHVWREKRPANLKGMSHREAIGFDIANKDGTLTAYGKKVGKRKKSQRSWNL